MFLRCLGVKNLCWVGIFGKTGIFGFTGLPNDQIVG